MRPALIVPSSLLAVACLPIPHTHLKRPDVTFVIQDAAGRPVPSARLRFYSGIIVGKSVREAATLTLDTNGRGRLESQRELHWFVLLVPDGEAPWVWAWCADAPGYRRAAEELDAQADTTVHVVLTRDDHARGCLNAPRSLYDVSAEGTR